MDQDDLADVVAADELLVASTGVIGNRLPMSSVRAGIAAAAAFDQFPYTHHLECGLLLKRRAAAKEPA